MSDKKVKVVKKTERQQDIEEDLRRLDISRLFLLIQKYPEKAKEKLFEIQGVQSTLQTKSN